MNEKVAYVQSQIACALINLEGMKLQNELDRKADRPLTYEPHHFEELCSHYQLYHNQVVTALWN